MRIVLDVANGLGAVASPAPRPAVAIDLGSLTSRVACAEAGRLMPQVVRNSLGNEATATAVYYGDAASSTSAVDGVDEHFIGVEPRAYGEAAATRQFMRPANTVTDLVTWLLAAPAERRTVAGADYAVAQPAAYYLRELLRLVPAFTLLGAGPQPLVAVAVPACASAAASRALRQACVLAGVPEADLLLVRSDEALAAYFHHSQYGALPAAAEGDAAAPATRVVVVDFGHSCVCAAAYDVSRAALVPVAAEADDAVGSAAIDAAVTEVVLEEVARLRSAAVADALRADTRSLRRVAREAKKTKEVLSTTDEAAVQLEGLLGGELDLRLAVTRRRLEERLEPVLRRLSEMLERLRAAASPDDGAPLRVEVVGGGWRVPCVQETIRAALGAERLGVSLDANLSVVEGCAIAAQMVLAARDPPEGTAAAATHEAHRVSLAGLALSDSAHPDATPLTAAEAAEVAAWAETERVLAARDDVILRRLAAVNDIDAYVLQTLQGLERLDAHAAGDAALLGRSAAVRAALQRLDEEYIRNEVCCGDTTEAIERRLADARAQVAADLPELEAQYAREREREAQREEELRRLHEAHQREEQAAAEDADLKSDPQRLRVAQRRREQGVTLFKEECYAEAHKRFVQAIAALAQLYDTTDENNLRAKNEISLSCYLNMASCAIKLSLYANAVENASNALRIAPDSRKAHFRRGQGYAGQKEYKKALAEFALAGKDEDSVVKAEYDKAAALLEREKQREKKMFSKMFS